MHSCSRDHPHGRQPGYRSCRASMAPEEVVSVSRETARELETELGSQARKGLEGRLCHEVLQLLQAKSCLPVAPNEQVPVERCPYCDDGGLRIVGYVQRNHQLIP